MAEINGTVGSTGGLLPVLPFELPSIEQLILVKTNIAGFFFDAFISVNHTKDATITSHPVQTGANLTDHIYLNPIELTMRIKMSDASASLVSSQFQSRYTRSVSAVDVLTQLWKNRIPFQVSTRTDIYQNMVIESITINDDYQTLYGLDCTVNLREILMSSVATVKVSSRPDVTDANYGGNLTGQELNQELQSIAYRYIFGGNDTTNGSFGGR